MKTKVKGIEIRNNIIKLRFSYQKKRYFKSLKLEANNKNLKLAEKILSEIKYDIATDNFNIKHHFPDLENEESISTDNRLDDLIKIYFQQKEPEIRATTLISYKSIISNFISQYNLYKEPNELTMIEITKIRIDMLKKYKSRTFNLHCIVINNFFTWLYDNDFISKRLKLKTIKNTEKTPTPFCLNELNKILSHCENKTMYNLFNLIAFSGLRIGEALVLSWQDIDLEDKKMTISHAVRLNNKSNLLKTTKTDKTRTVNLLDDAYFSLKEQFKITGKNNTQTFKIELSDKSTVEKELSLVFVNNKNNFFNRRKICSYFKSCCQKSQVSYRSVCNLRHTYASRMLTAGINPAYIATQLGHSNFLMLATIYGIYMEGENKDEHKKALIRLKSPKVK